MTRQQIGKLSGLSKPTVNEALDILSKENLILLDDVKSNGESGRPGPKAQQVSYNRFRSKIMAIDIGGSKIRILISDLEGNLLANATKPTPTDAGRSKILNTIKKLSDESLELAKVDLDEIESIVVGTPGTIDSKNGFITRSYNLPDWENFSLSYELTRLLSKEVQVENEAHLAIYGESWLGAAKGLNNAAIMSVGVGIGLGLLIDGQVYKGFNGIAGEIGNLPIFNSDLNGLNTSANFEFYASATGIERSFENMKNNEGAKEVEKMADGERVSAKTIYEAATKGNKLANQLKSNQIELLGRGIAAICCVTNPQVFILAGGMAPSLEKNLDKLKATVAKYTLIPPQLVISQLKDLATAYGALRRGIESINRATLISILSEIA